MLMPFMLGCFAQNPGHVNALHAEVGDGSDPCYWKMGVILTIECVFDRQMVELMIIQN
jgi:hypothetical protein